MRGEVDPQSSMFHYFSVESRIRPITRQG